MVNYFTSRLYKRLLQQEIKYTVIGKELSGKEPGVEVTYIGVSYIFYFCIFDLGTEVCCLRP